jgi:energy-coupling factor transporter ATP-binding protein EcfA2
MIDLLGQRILKKGLISRNQLLKAIERQRLFGGRLGFNLIALNLISESDLANFFTFAPDAPNNAEETNLEAGFITDLILKHCIFLKKFNIFDLSGKIKLPASLILDIITDLRRDRFIEIVKGDISLATSEYALTDAGINRAILSLETCRYTGPAPVSLNEYRYAVEIQTIKSIEITYDQLKDTFGKIVVSENKLKTLGSAINSGKPIFLYGSPGNGKTTIAELIGDALPHEVYIPYSVLAGNQVIIIYDQVNHKPINEKNDDNHLDQRWIKIKRPVVIAGGELTLQTLDLNFNSDSKYYEAPLQMKANNGLFIVDDFGRQIVDPQTLLNRWIIPLDRQIDFLTLHTGMKFEIPFDQLIIFATNLPPKQIADEAFLRRLRYKINVDSPTIDEYRQIFINICNSNYIEYNKDVFSHLIKQYENSRRNLSRCDPRDLIDQIIDFASFDKKPPALTNESIDKAWENYFVS